MGLSTSGSSLSQQSSSVLLRSRHVNFYTLSVPNPSLKKAHYKNVIFKNGYYQFSFDSLDVGFLVVEMDGKFFIKKVGEHSYIAVYSAREKNVYSLSKDLFQLKLPVLFEISGIRIYCCEEDYLKVDEYIVPLKKQALKIDANLGSITLEEVVLEDISLGDTHLGDIELGSISFGDITLQGIELPTTSFRS